MPKAKKKSEPIVGIGADPENKLVVQKSRPLFALWQSDLTLPEFKILDMYLARINTSKPDQRTVLLTKGQLEQALGVTKINQPDLEIRLAHLYQPINLAKGQKKKINLLGLFEHAEADQDSDGQWKITLTCTESAMKYIFKVEELGYLRYKLRSITNLTSRYTYVLFCYLEDNRFRKSWSVKVDELKTILSCVDDELYKDFRYFNQRILKRCHAELQEKTDCKFRYYPVKEGRKVTSIRFELETLPVLEPADPIDPNQISLFEVDHLAMLRDGFADLELADADLETIYQHLITMPESGLPLDPGGSYELAARQTQYLRILRAKVDRQRTKNPIPHLTNYICAIIERDAKKSAEAASKATQSPLSSGARLGTFEREAIARMLAEESENEE